MRLEFFEVFLLDGIFPRAFQDRGAQIVIKRITGNPVEMLEGHDMSGKETHIGLVGENRR